MSFTLFLAGEGRQQESWNDCLANCFYQILYWHTEKYINHLLQAPVSVNCKKFQMFKFTIFHPFQRIEYLDNFYF